VCAVYRRRASKWRREREREREREKDGDGEGRGTQAVVNCRRETAGRKRRDLDLSLQILACTGKCDRKCYPGRAACCEWKESMQILSQVDQ